MRMSEPVLLSTYSNCSSACNARTTSYIAASSVVEADTEKKTLYYHKAVTSINITIAPKM